MSEDIRRDPASDPDTTTRPVDDRSTVGHDDTVRPHEDVPVDTTTRPVDDRSTVGHDDTVRPHEDVPVDTTNQPAPTERPAQDTAHSGQIDRDPSSERVEPAGASGPGASTPWTSHAGLLPDDDLGGYQRQWDELQVRFIDEPRQTVRQADDLVEEVTRKIAERFTSGREDFEERWEGDNEPTTEELRQALQRYRDFFQRLVTR